MDFLEKTCKKMVFNRKSECHHRILYLQKSLGTKFQIKLTILSFWAKLSQKEYFQSEKDKKENHQRILRIRISLGPKFHLQQTVLISGYFRSKADKMIE